MACQEPDQTLRPMKMFWSVQNAFVGVRWQRYQVWSFAKKSWGVMGAEFWAESEYGQGFEVPIYDLCPKEVQP